jgi:diguanylate cyclase (GGDEF)-like protein/PAS domain S-box-containing protein
MAALSITDRRATFDALVRDHPDARVVAVALTGLIVPMPRIVPLTGQASIEGIGSMLDVIHPSDAKVLIDAWELTKTAGVTSVSVRAWHDRDSVMVLHFLDLIEEFGVVMCVVTGYQDVALPPEPSRFVPRTSVIRKDELSYITAVDDAAVAILGWRADELVGQRAHDLIHPDDEEYGVSNWLRMLSRPGHTSQVRLRYRHRDGSYRWLEITNHNNLCVRPDPHILAEMVDVTGEVEAINALRTNERMLRRLAEALPIGVLYIESDRRISYRNARLGAIAGVEAADDVDVQLQYLLPNSRDAAMTAIDAAFARCDDADVEVTFQVPGGGLRRCLMSLRPVTNTDGTVVGVITCLTDITDEANRREELERRVRHDQLTSCLNHASILAELQRTLDDPQPGTWTVAAFIDLDEFKETNDRYGHPEGDRMLKHVAAQLWQVAGEDGLVGRVGGDEFLLVVRTPADARAVRTVAADVADALALPILLQAELIRPRASVGVAFAAGEGLDASDVVAAADTAMYRSKRRGDGIPLIVPTG